MSFFHQWWPGGLLADPPDFTHRRAELLRVRDAVWAGTNATLVDALIDDVRDAEDRSDRIAVAAETSVAATRARTPAWIEEWTRTEPDNSTALTLHGAIETLRAWQVRGGALANETSADRLLRFQSILAGAEELCRQAAHLDDADATPWIWLVHMARGQEVGPSETLLRWREMTARAPEIFQGHLQALYSVSPKWGYPAEYMYKIVDATSDAPDGSPLHALTSAAHIEVWLRLSRADQRQFLRRPEVRAQADAANTRLRAGVCERPADYVAHNQAACWYRLTGEYAKARPHFDVLGEHRTQWPWDYLPLDPKTQYRLAKWRAGRA